MRKTLLLLFLSASMWSIFQAQSARELAAIYADLAFFETPLALSLKKGTKKGDIEKIKNNQLKETARLLVVEQYDASYRMTNYEAYLTPTTLGQHLIIGDGYEFAKTKN